jgi:hypothetical protein
MAWSVSEHTVAENVVRLQGSGQRRRHDMLSRLHTIPIIAADDGDPSVRHVPVDEISILNSPTPPFRFPR